MGLMNRVLRGLKSCECGRNQVRLRLISQWADATHLYTPLRLAHRGLSRERLSAESAHFLAQRQSDRRARAEDSTQEGKGVNPERAHG